MRLMATLILAALLVAGGPAFATEDPPWRAEALSAPLVECEDQCVIGFLLKGHQIFLTVQFDGKNGVTIDFSSPVRGKMVVMCGYETTQAPWCYARVGFRARAVFSISLSKQKVDGQFMAVPESRIMTNPK